MSLLNNELTESIGKNISNTIGNLQENFLQFNWGEAINDAVDSGIRIILPDFIEDEVIEVKDALVQGGIKEGIKTAIDATIKKGKEIIGIFTGNLEDISQAEAISKYGGLINNLSSMLEKVIDKCISNKFIKEGLGELIKNGKETILNYAEKNVETVNKDQIKKIKEIDECITNWHKAYENRDFKKMQSEYRKIENRIDDVMAIEDIIKKARVVENLHNLIKNNGNDFNLTVDELELANQLA